MLGNEPDNLEAIEVLDRARERRTRSWTASAREGFARRGSGLRRSKLDTIEAIFNCRARSFACQ